MPFIINVLGPIVAQMGLLLLRERVIRKVTVITLKALADMTSNKLTHELVDTVAEALEPPSVGPLK